jgi:HlyD family secretion protein
MANAGQSRLTSIVLWLSGIFVICLIVYGVRSFTREVVEVSVVPVTYQTLLSTVATNGKVEPVEDFQAQAPFSGAIQQIFVSVDDKVRKGQLLVRMDDADAKSRLANAQAILQNAIDFGHDLAKGGNSEELHRNQADIASAQLEQQQAADELQTRKTLLAKGAASPAEVSAAQQRLDAANLTLKNAQTHLNTRYDQQETHNAEVHVEEARASVAAAESNLAKVDIRSDIDGTVFNIPYSQYDFVEFGKVILEVADLNHIRVRAFFDEPEIGGLAVGQPVTIEWAAKPGSKWHGHVALVPTSIFIYNTRNVGICLITIDDPTPDLIPNTNVTVTVTEAERPHVLSIPREAWHNDNGQSYVFRIVNGHLQKTPIRVGVITLTSVEVLSGLSANDNVVRAAKSSITDLTNGLEVKQVE